MISRPPLPPQAAQVQSLIGVTTTRSGGLLWRSISRSRVRETYPASLGARSRC